MSESAKGWYLKGKLNDNSPWIVPINLQEFIIGRLEECDLILSTSTVSRKHSKISIHRDTPFLTDMGSKNGTFVNGEKIAGQVRLNDQDIIKISSTEFVICQGHPSGDEANSEYTAIGDDAPASGSFAGHYQLSKREEQTLYFLLKGMSVKKIAQYLFISSGTAKNHVLKIYKKTDCHTRIELATRFNEFQAKS